MIRWHVYLICGVLVVGPIGCSEEPAPASRPQQSASVENPPSTPAPAPESLVEEKEPEFVYFADDRRDPFVPLSTIRRPLEASAEPATPLQSYDVDQFRLIGVIVGKGESKAMVVAPDGKSYVLARGVKIGKNNGVVIKINSDVILVEEKYYDFSGNVIENIKEITVPKREGV